MQGDTRFAVSVVAAAFALAGLATTTASSAWSLDAVPKIDPTASAAETCNAVFGNDAGTQTRSMGAVAPEQSLAEDVTWKANWKPGSAVEVVGCAAIDGKFLNELSTIQQAKPDDRLFVHTFAVPKDAANGAMVCERGVVLGESATGAAQAERTDADCFTVAAATGAGSAAAVAPAPVSAASTTPAKPDAEPAAVSQPAAGAEPGRTSPSKSPIVAGSAETRSAADASAPASTRAAAPTQSLARTAANDRMLLALAGLLLLLGGSMVAFSGPLRLAGQRRC